MIPQNKSLTWGHLAGFTAYAIFGFNILVCKDLTGSHLLSPIALFCLRSIGAGLLFWLLSAFMPREKVRRADFAKIAAASFLGFFMAQLTFLMAIPDITPMDCSIISALSPLYTMFIAAWVLKEPITARKMGGVLLSLAGILFLILNTAGTSGATAESSARGIALMIANSFCFSLYLGVFRPVISRYSVITFMKWVFFFSTCMSLPLAFDELTHTAYSTFSLSIWSELAFLIVCSTFITYFLIPVSQKRLRPTLVCLYSYVQPIIAIAISIYIGMDTLDGKKIMAAIAVFGGVALVNYSRGATIVNGRSSAREHQ